MPRPRAELQAEAARLIAAMLDWTEQTDAPDLTAIEDEVLKLRQQSGERLAAAAVAQQQTAEPLRLAGPIITATTAGSGFFPLDQQLKVAGQPWSESLCKPAVWLDALLTFEQTESVLAQVGQMMLSDSTAWRQLQKRGAQAQALEAARRLAATATLDLQQIVAGEVMLTERLAATMDGGHDGRRHDPSP